MLRSLQYLQGIFKTQSKKVNNILPHNRWRSKGAIKASRAWKREHEGHCASFRPKQYLVVKFFVSFLCAKIMMDGFIGVFIWWRLCYSSIVSSVYCVRKALKVNLTYFCQSKMLTVFFWNHSALFRRGFVVNLVATTSFVEPVLRRSLVYLLTFWVIFIKMLLKLSILLHICLNHCLLLFWR